MEKCVCGIVYTLQQDIVDALCVCVSILTLDSTCMDLMKQC